ncbi:Hsp70 family protein [Virgisporangium aliadipatigenens]|uniref:Hsp70 family protein n=1 Tax=Virgisporangium aliadipatigenens TaxID=741659 RepID=UPI001EF29DA3|nr:Hsp70 family protein [Virgisporangium aliadipatigenens]
MYVLGIDVGTSHTVAVARTPDGRVRPLLFDGSPLLPSAVYADGTTLLVGRDAVASAKREPARFEPHPKRRVDEGSVLLGEREVSVVELLAAVLRRVDDEWTRVIGSARPSVVLTVPATWGAHRRDVLLAAARAAGYARVHLVPEPVAAATYFAEILGEAFPVGSVLAIHDVGAGTSDVSLVARSPENFEVVGTAGADVGGIDLDAAVVDDLKRRHAHPAWERLTRPRTVAERRAARLLWDDVRTAKERLSRNTSADVHVPLVDADAHLTRDELETLATPTIAASIALTTRLVERLDRPLAGVFLVGGTSRLPLLGTLLFQALGRAPVVLEQPETVVAEGSIRHAPQTEAPASAPMPEVRRGRRPWLRLAGVAAALPVAAGAVLAVAGAVVGVILVGIVLWSVLTGQGWIPDLVF